MELPDGKYIQYSGETGAFASYIRDGVNSTDTAAYSIEEVKDWLYDDEGNIVGSILLPWSDYEESGQSPATYEISISTEE